MIPVGNASSGLVKPAMALAFTVSMKSPCRFKEKLSVGQKPVDRTYVNSSESIDQP